MARNLKTGWVIVATSGSTIDGREIKKEWLTGMAESYSEKLFCAQLWPDHKRVFGAQGKVLALKTEPATEPALKGEVHLMAILAPSDDLVWANKSGKYKYTSIEVEKNFANKGFFYLGGLAVTDIPASLGTSELQFSAESESEKFYFTGSPIDLSSAEPEKSFFSFLRKQSPDTEQEYTMTPEQLAAIQKSQSDAAEAIKTAFTSAIATLGEQFKTLLPAPATTPAPATAPIIAPEPETTAEFVSKKDYDELANKFNSLDEKFTELQKTPAGGTKPAGDDAGAQTGVIC